MSKQIPLISDRKTLRAMLNVALSEFRQCKSELSHLNKLTNSSKTERWRNKTAYSQAFSTMNKARATLKKTAFVLRFNLRGEAV